MKKMLLAAVAALMMAAPAFSQRAVVDSGSADTYAFRDRRENVKPSEIKVLTQNGEKVYDVEVFQADRTHYMVSLGFLNTAPVKKGDTMLARIRLRTFYARQETGESAVTIYFQESSAPYSKSFSTAIGSGPEWRDFDIPFKAHQDFAPGEAVVELGLASLSQHIQIAGVQILDYGPDKPLSELPMTRFTYAGREENAPWRAEALKRIEENRTAPVTETVKDAKGKALKGADVHIRMTRSDFLWGSAVNAPRMFQGGKPDSMYVSVLKEFFNTAILGNGLKAGGWYWDDNRKESSLRTFNWLYDNGFRIRGHNLVWPAWKFNPRAARIIAHENPEVFDDYVKAQFYERMAFTKGRVVAWDVVNEPMHEQEFLEFLPKDVMVDWFKLAKRLDPDAQLFINEYAMLNRVQSPDNIRAYIDMIQDLLSKGAPVEAVGVQGHIGTQPRAPELVLTDLDLFKPLGLPVQITEWDINTKDEELQAEYSRDFLIAVYSHPVVTGVNMWGFWEADHWKPDAALFRRDWSIKPNGEVWKELVLGAWKTDVSVRSDKRGNAQTRAHLGDYEITVSYKGREYKTTTHVGKEGVSLDVAF